MALRAVREMLGMDVAYLSEIVGDDMILRELEGDGESFRLAREGSLPREQTYCKRMLDGRIPNLIPDVLADDRTASLPICSFLKLFARLIADTLEREEATLAISELAALVNAADDGIMGLTLAWVVTSWNTGAERIFGYSPSEAIGHDITDLIGLPGSEEKMRQSLEATGAG